MDMEENNIVEMISLSLSILAILGSLATYFIHDRRLKKQEQKINDYQLKQIEDAQIESQKAYVIGDTHKDAQNATILTITNKGKSVARNIRIIGFGDGNYCFYGPDNLPYEFLNPGDSFKVRFTVNVNNLYKEKITYYWDDDFKADNYLEQIISVR